MSHHFECWQAQNQLLQLVLQYQPAASSDRISNADKENKTKSQGSIGDDIIHHGKGNIGGVLLAIPAIDGEGDSFLSEVCQDMSFGNISDSALIGQDFPKEAVPSSRNSSNNSGYFLVEGSTIQVGSH